MAVPGNKDDVPGYQLRAAVIHWQAGNGLSGAEDRVRRTLANEEGPRVNPFFRELYRGVAVTLSGLRAKEHTAQVPPPNGRNAKTSSARPSCRSCTARRRWNSASTSTR